MGNLNLSSLYREIVDKRVLVVLLVYNKNANKKTLVIPSSNINQGFEVGSFDVSASQ